MARGAKNSRGSENAEYFRKMVVSNSDFQALSEGNYVFCRSKCPYSEQSTNDPSVESDEISGYERYKRFKNGTLPGRRQGLIIKAIDESQIDNVSVQDKSICKTQEQIRRILSSGDSVSNRKGSLQDFGYSATLGDTRRRSALRVAIFFNG